MVEYWESLSALARFFYCLAVPATVVLIIQTILAILGIGGSDGDADVGFEGEAGDFDAVDDLTEAASGFRIFTVKGIVAFFAIFGWTGIVMCTAGCKALLTTVVSFIAGAAAMALVAFIFYSLSKLQYDGTFDYKYAVGHDGKVYIPIPGKRKGVGKIQITIGERFLELNAMTSEDEPLPTGTIVSVTSVEENNLIVVKKG